VFHGSEPGTCATGFSEEEEVGLREKCQPARAKAPVMMVRRICVDTRKRSAVGLLMSRSPREVLGGIWPRHWWWWTYVELGILFGALL
jgi:hypothetical protein